MNKYFYTGIILLLTFIFISTSLYAADFEVGVESAILVDYETGQVLFEKNADEVLPPASITKIMTLLLAMEEIEKGTINLDDKISISKHAQSMGGSQIFLAADTRVEVEDLLEAVTVASANDASVAIAEAIGGTYSNFVSQMNEKATELGMVNTNFVNSTGLPTEHGEHYSTARDISIMARELIKHPQVLKWASIWHDILQLPNRKADLTNTNKLINKYPGMDGLKTGHTQEAGFCLAATAKRENMRFISVVLKAETEQEREEVTSRLLDYGFNAFIKEQVVEQGSKVQNINIADGKKTTTTAEAARDLYVVIKRGSKNTLEREIKLRDGLFAPIKKGEVLGQEAIIQDGKVLAAVDLLATEDIAKANIFVRLWRGFLNWIGSLIGKFIN
ncbi:MAG: D-alanyl-D-alanine carboxypeptidase [Firmicutes bacterium]|nr:D-alanyl-D-alanine carboxypeptidase [Bacillota bacterium]